MSIGRVSSLQLNLMTRDHVNRATVQLEEASRELATGLKANVFRELGAGASVIFQLRMREENTQAFLTSNQALDTKLEAMTLTVDTIRETTESVISNVLVNMTRSLNAADALQDEAFAAIETMISSLNVRFGDDHLFAGLQNANVPMTNWQQADSDTGLSPADVIQGIVGTGPASVADVDAILAELDLIFDSADTTSPDRNYESTFFNGSPALDASGNPSDRLTAMVSEGHLLKYGVQANDPGFRDTLKGLAMLATVNIDTITDQDTYDAWLNAAADYLTKGSEGLLEISAAIGFDRNVLDTANARHTEMSIIQRSQISNLESADPYEATTELTALETQLQASYSIAARMANLSILNYIR